MKWYLPDRAFAKSKGWTHQVQWLDDGKPCFVRCKSGAAADFHADALRKQGLRSITVIDLTDALQVH